jgi:hypothetical protein
LTVVFFTDRDLGKQFPGILRNAGLNVERHCDHFQPDTSDDTWLAVVGQRGWVALSHDKRIRYKPNERAAVLTHRVRLLIIVGTVPFPLLAESFVATRHRIEAFLDQHQTPLIAKVYRASPKAIRKNPHAPGRVQYWYP